MLSEDVVGTDALEIDGRRVSTATGSVLTTLEVAVVLILDSEDVVRDFLLVVVLDSSSCFAGSITAVLGVFSKELA